MNSSHILVDLSLGSCSNAASQGLSLCFWFNRFSGDWESELKKKNKPTNGTDGFICKPEIETQAREQMYGHQGVKELGWEALGDWDWYTIDSMYKIDN